MLALILVLAAEASAPKPADDVQAKLELLAAAANASYISDHDFTLMGG